MRRHGFETYRGARAAGEHLRFGFGLKTTTDDLMYLIHPAIAIAIAAAAFPHEHFGAPIILYLLVGIIVGIPYIAYVRKSARWHHEAEGPTQSIAP